MQEPVGLIPPATFDSRGRRLLVPRPDKTKHLSFAPAGREGVLRAGFVRSALLYLGKLCLSRRASLSRRRAPRRGESPELADFQHPFHQQIHQSRSLTTANVSAYRFFFRVLVTCVS